MTKLDTEVLNDFLSACVAIENSFKTVSQLHEKT